MSDVVMEWLQDDPVDPRARPDAGVLVAARRRSLMEALGEHLFPEGEDVCVFCGKHISEAHETDACGRK